MVKKKYQDEDDDFNKLLNSSPKKNPKYTNSIKKDGEWEALEALTDKNDDDVVDNLDDALLMPGDDFGFNEGIEIL